jgi:hypothetical protein
MQADLPAEPGARQFGQRQVAAIGELLRGWKTRHRRVKVDRKKWNARRRLLRECRDGPNQAADDDRKRAHPEAAIVLY